LRFQHLIQPKSSEETKKLVSCISSIAVTIESCPVNVFILVHSIAESKCHNLIYVSYDAVNNKLCYELYFNVCIENEFFSSIVNLTSKSFKSHTTKFLSNDDDIIAFILGTSITSIIFSLCTFYNVLGSSNSRFHIYNEFVLSVVIHLPQHSIHHILTYKHGNSVFIIFSN
jgi:hypothetical protein